LLGFDQTVLSKLFTKLTADLQRSENTAHVSRLLTIAEAHLIREMQSVNQAIWNTSYMDVSSSNETDDTI
jgi:hypothetical protein